MFCSDLAIECFEKARRSRPLKPLQALKDFRVIYDASGKGSSDGRGERSPTRGAAGGGQAIQQDRPKYQSPVRRARSLSPVKDIGTTASRDTTRGKAATTTVPKSTSMNPSQCGKEKRPPQGSAGVRTDAVRQQQVPETTSTAQIRQGRKTKEVGGSVSSDGLPANETTKTAATQRLMQIEATRSKTAATSTKPVVHSKQSHSTLKEPQVQKRRSTVGADSTDDNSGLPSRGS